MSGSSVGSNTTGIDFGTLGNATTSTVWENAREASCTVTFGGTFGGATVVVEGSDAVGGPWATLVGEGGAASFTAAGVAQIGILPRFWRVRSSGGTGTAVTAVATLYLAPVRSLLAGTTMEIITAGNATSPPVAGAVNRVEIVGGVSGTPGRVGLRAAGDDTNVSMVLEPKGTGALIGEFPDNTTAGGNARGTNAVDWQMLRGNAANVASGSTSTISGGTSNTASALQSVVGGGGANTASGNNSVVAGGNQNSATSTNAAIGGGSANTASGSFSWAPGGLQASTRGNYGMGAWAAGQIAAAGDAQREEHVLRRQTIDATATRLTADNAVAGTTNTINLSNFSAIAGRLVVRARAAAGANLSASWFIDVSATRDANAASTLIEGGGGTAIAPTHSRGTASAWRIDLTADTTNGGIAVTVTGAAATTINWTAAFIALQVATTS